MDKKAEPYWITSSEEGVNDVNRWIAFRQDIVLKDKPKNLIASLAADTKYWLWINGDLVVFEGGLKRGPNPNDTYFDKVDLTAYLKKGKNQIAILLWHFGKSGFAHNSSGKAGLLFELNAGNVQLNSDNQWLCCLHPAYGTANNPAPNYRLAESNISFDARLNIDGWQTTELSALKGFAPAVQIGKWGDSPWNQLVERPIPQWKDYGIQSADFIRRIGSEKDTIIAPLPYNMQMTPILTLNDPIGGQLININTDHTVAGGTDNLRAEYITRSGTQEYESLGWLNGENIQLIVPKNVEILSLKYRETGYDAYPEGSFQCSDDFYNKFWEKASRTLYVNMRDNYFDCPDRERAQWWGDTVLLMGESFYTYSTSAHALMSKAIRELAGWQRADSTLFSPIPGNFNDELPCQILASVGYYGFWNYYMNTGDRDLIEEVYPAVKKYLSLWKTDSSGLTELRSGGWLWGDWGDNRDLRLIIAGWHFLALKGASEMADILGLTDDASTYRQTMELVKEGYNMCWNGYAYRHPSYHLQTDDRVQALAVISGIADVSKYDHILRLFKTQFHASPYMEKYVMEALFVMGEGKYALERTHKRFDEMVNHPTHTTLFEGWGIGERGFGGGTTNHAWSGGAQTVIAHYLCGIVPLEPGFKTFLIEPEPASFASASISVPTVSGTIRSSFDNGFNECVLQVEVPAGTNAIVRLKSLPEQIKIDGKTIRNNHLQVDESWRKKGYTALKLASGKYNITINEAL